MKSKIILLSVWLVFTVRGIVLAQGLINKIPNQVLVGARPLSMGETFVSVADDINAIYWNPAGLPTLDQLGVNSMHANLFHSGVGLNYLSLAIPGPHNTGIGVDWMNIGYEDDELEFRKNKFNFSFGYKPLQRLSLGFNVKYIRMNAALDQVTQGAFHGWGADLGLLYNINSKLKLGLVVHDLTNTRLKGIEGSIYQRNLRVGVAYQLLDNLLIATDFDDRFHGGYSTSCWRCAPVCSRTFIQMKTSRFLMASDWIFPFGDKGSVLIMLLPIHQRCPTRIAPRCRS